MKKYILVEVDSSTPERWDVCITAKHPTWMAGHATVRIADVTDLVYHHGGDGGNAIDYYGVDWS